MRQPRVRDTFARRKLHPRREADHVPGGERRRRLRGDYHRRGGRLGPRQRDGAAGDARAGDLVPRPRRVVRDDPWRACGRGGAGGAPSVASRRPRQLGPAGPGRRHGRRDGPRRRGQEGHRHHDAYDVRREAEGRRDVFPAADGPRLRRRTDHRRGGAAADAARHGDRGSRAGLDAGGSPGGLRRRVCSSPTRSRRCRSRGGRPGPGGRRRPPRRRCARGRSRWGRRWPRPRRW